MVKKQNKRARNRFYASALHFNTEWSYAEYLKKKKWPKGTRR